MSGVSVAASACNKLLKAFVCLAVPELIQHIQPYYARSPLVSFKLGLEEPPVVLCGTKVYFRSRHWCRFRANLGTGLSLTTLDAMD